MSKKGASTEETRSKSFEPCLI